MNHLSGFAILLCLIGCAACGARTAESQSRDPNAYDLHYTVELDTAASLATVSMTLRQSNRQVRELSFAADKIRLLEDDSDGSWTLEDSRLVWTPEASGGQLSWTTDIPHRRNDGGFDAYLSGSWGIFRAEDLIPRARVRALRGAQSTTTLDFELPREWSVITEYSAAREPILIDNPARRFDQPTGWIAVGDLGVRRETIAATRVAIVAPTGQSVRRMDMLALLNWSLPELNEILSEPLPRLTIFSADDPMWRGGLSAPASLFIHADRPLISENATSTLLHEVMHIALRFQSSDNDDWITEGLAEYFSLQLLHRSGAITVRRYQAAQQDLQEWSKQATQLCGRNSNGPVTALAVTLFTELDREIREASGGARNLDDLVADLQTIEEEVSLAVLQEAASTLIGQKSKTLVTDKLPGCSTMTASHVEPPN